MLYETFFFPEVNRAACFKFYHVYESLEETILLMVQLQFVILYMSIAVSK